MNWFHLLFRADPITAPHQRGLYPASIEEEPFPPAEGKILHVALGKLPLSFFSDHAWGAKRQQLLQPRGFIGFGDPF